MPCPPEINQIIQTIWNFFGNPFLALGFFRVPFLDHLSTFSNSVFGVFENVLRINKIIYFCFIEIVRKCIKTWIFFFIVCSSLMHHRGSAIFIDVPFKCHFWAFWDLGEVKCWCLLVWKQKSNQVVFFFHWQPVCRLQAQDFYCTLEVSLGTVEYKAIAKHFY